MGMAQVCHTWHISTAVVAAPGRARCVPLSVMGLLHELIGTPDPTPRRVALWGILSSCSNAFFFLALILMQHKAGLVLFSAHTAGFGLRLAILLELPSAQAETPALSYTQLHAGLQRCVLQS